MLLFDSHCHLQDHRFAENAGAVIQRARRAGVTRFACCGSREEDWKTVAVLAANEEGVLPLYGIHPWYIEERSNTWFALLENTVHKMGACGIGEIGLDRAIEPRDDELQERIFVQQLRLARDCRLPVSIHCRRAWGALLDILNREKGLAYGGVIHSYSGAPDLVPELERLGCSISFSGSITRANNRRGREALAKVSPGRLCIETDSPDILPGGADGTLNEPSNLIAVLECVARILGAPEEKVAELTFNNARRLFVRGGK